MADTLRWFYATHSLPGAFAFWRWRASEEDQTRLKQANREAAHILRRVRNDDFTDRDVMAEADSWLAANEPEL